LPLEYTDTKLEWAPGTALWTGVTGAGVSRANSAWGVISASTPAAWVLAGIVVGDWAISVTGGDFEIDVGVGPGGSEVVIATIPSFAEGPSDSYHHFFFPVPIDAIPAGSRVSVRLRMEGTSVFVWRIGIGYYTKPISGVISTYTGIPAVSQSGVVPATQTSGATWANPAGFQTIENAPSDVYIAGIAFDAGTADTEVEVDLATGAAASEVVFTTVRKNIQASEYGFSSFLMFPILYDSVASGTRLSFRARASGLAQTVKVRLLYYPKAATLSNRKTSNKAIITIPSAADGIAPSYATSFGAGVYTQLIAATSSALQLAGITMDKDGGAVPDECEVDIGVGAAASEVVIATWRYSSRDNTRGNGFMWMLPAPIDSIPNNSRVAARVRNNTVTNNPTARLSILAYQGLAGGVSQTNRTLKVAPAAATGISIVPTAGEWTDGAWVQCVASMAFDSLIAGIEILPGSGIAEFPNSFEIDIGFGASSAEVVATTVRGFFYRPDFGKYLLPTGLRCPASTRVSFRIRKSITATNNNWTAALMYYENVIFTGGPPPTRAAPPIGSVQVLLGNVIYATPARAINIEYQTTGAAILEGSLDAETFITLDTATGAGLRTINGVVAPFIRPSATITVVFRKTKAKM
jgi:hypothetical protein